MVLKTLDKLSGKHIYTLARFTLPLTTPEVLVPLKRACTDAFARGMIRDFFQ